MASTPSAPGQDLVQRVVEIGRAARELLPHLQLVFLEALLHLFGEFFLQVPVLERRVAPRGVVHHEVGDEGPGQPACLGGGVVGQERIERTSRRGRRGRGLRSRRRRRGGRGRRGFWRSRCGSRGRRRGRRGG